jgi:hypothetical protein
VTFPHQCEPAQVDHVRLGRVVGQTVVDGEAR